MRPASASNLVDGDRQRSDADRPGRLRHVHNQVAPGGQLHDVVLDGPGSTIPTDHTQDGRVWTWSVANMSSGDSLTARLEFPALVNATAPAWQRRMMRSESGTGSGKP